MIAASKAQGRQFKVYDAFGMIPPPSDRDGRDVHQRYRVIRAGQAAGIGGELYYGYEPDLYGKVRDAFRECDLEVESNHIELVKGLYEDVLLVHEPVALAHLDCDWYEPVKTCLKRIVPCLTTGGVLVVDDYYTWSGCRDAVDEYFADKAASYRFEKKSRLHITRAEPARADIVKDITPPPG